MVAPTTGPRPGARSPWILDELAAAGVPGPDGDLEEGAPGSFVSVTVTVRAVDDPGDEVENTAEVTAPDPSDESADDFHGL